MTRRRANLWSFVKKPGAEDKEIPSTTTEPVPWQSVLSPDKIDDDDWIKNLKTIHKTVGEGTGFNLTLFPGCSHRCRYGWCKQQWYKSVDERATTTTIPNISHDIELLQRHHYRVPILIPNVGDPYDLARDDNSFTRSVLKLFRQYDQPFRILTKGGMKAAADFDLYGPNDCFGSTLTCDNDLDSRQNELGAALPGDRIAAIRHL